jgi:hypothetical protein
LLFSSLIQIISSMVSFDITVTPLTRYNKSTYDFFTRGDYNTHERVYPDPVGLPHPDPLVRGKDPDPSVINQK